MKISKSQKDFSSSGNALIFTMFIITIMLTATLSVSRLSLSQIKRSDQSENSNRAYYAAESGIEQGLLMWRYNHNIQYPNDPEFIDDDMDMFSKQAVRMNLSSPGMTMENIADNTIIPTDLTQSFYDLQIWRKNPIMEDGTSKEILCQNPEDYNLLNDDCSLDDGRPITNTRNNYPLAKDNAVQYDVEGLNSIEIKWEYVQGQCIDPINCVLDFTPIDTDGNVIESEPCLGITGCKYAFPYSYSLNAGIGVFINLNPNTKSIRLRIFGGDLASYSITNNEGKRMPSKFTYISSVGYYGTAKRKIESKIDHNSGAILGPFDFTIYEGQ